MTAENITNDTGTKVGPLTLRWGLRTSTDATTEKALLEISSLGALSWSELRENQNWKKDGFFDAVINPKVSAVEECTLLARKLKKSGRYTDCVFLGIGGSSLGPHSLLDALSSRVDDKIRFHFLDNVDPVLVNATLAKITAETTLVVCASKSGRTFETLALLEIALSWLEVKRWQENLVIITGANGDLRDFASAHNLMILTIHETIVGRFSIFSPVGLFAAAIAGLDVESFIAGALEVHDYVTSRKLKENCLFDFATSLVESSYSRPTHVLMPYTSKLKHTGNWWVQLWSESLGKNSHGFNPISAVGTTDQHSLMQLLRDGPKDKVILFIEFLDFGEDRIVPVVPATSRWNSFQSLQGKKLSQLLAIGKASTERVLSSHNQANVSITIPRLDERGMGALYFSLCSTVVFLGALLKVCPFDQPGVDEGKQYIRAEIERISQRENSL